MTERAESHAVELWDIWGMGQQVHSKQMNMQISSKYIHIATSEELLILHVSLCI